VLIISDADFNVSVYRSQLAIDYWILIKGEKVTLFINLQKRRNLSLVEGKPLYGGHIFEKERK